MKRREGGICCGVSASDLCDGEARVDDADIMQKMAPTTWKRMNQELKDETCEARSRAELLLTGDPGSSSSPLWSTSSFGSATERVDSRISLPSALQRIDSRVSTSSRSSPPQPLGDTGYMSISSSGSVAERINSKVPWPSTIQRIDSCVSTTSSCGSSPSRLVESVVSPRSSVVTPRNSSRGSLPVKKEPITMEHKLHADAEIFQAIDEMRPFL
eukprot:TRINITY_DN84138_c0_g1_i1.p1 TRINITY_DN84138_c0_g1~~TRINITY_DN84138_c0_g1_i1.p1  ORF type:complete len:214 (+),score=21.15 TRINITY_DN84138_c0_g1_i1:22-663(+)